MWWALPAGRRSADQQTPAGQMCCCSRPVCTMWLHHACALLSPYPSQLSSAHSLLHALIMLSCVCDGHRAAAQAWGWGSYLCLSAQGPLELGGIALVSFRPGTSPISKPLHLHKYSRRRLSRRPVSDPSTCMLHSCRLPSQVVDTPCKCAADQVRCCVHTEAIGYSPHSLYRDGGAELLYD